MNRLTNDQPHVTMPTMESSQKPCEFVMLTILALTSGSSMGLLITQYTLIILKNCMQFSLDLLAISGKSLTFSKLLIPSKLVFILTNSVSTVEVSIFSGKSSPRTESTERQLPIASEYFDEAASSFESRPLDDKLSSND